jgi:hypothetical protein
VISWGQAFAFNWVNLYRYGAVVGQNGTLTTPTAFASAFLTGRVGWTWPVDDGQYGPCDQSATRE